MDWYYRYINVDRKSSNRLFTDFEIGLARAVLKSDSKNFRALTMLGDALTRRGQHKEALEIDKRTAKLFPKDPIVFYNLACSYSNLKMIKEALGALKKALKLGYDDIKYLMEDPDLKNLRKDPRFKRLLAQLRKKGNA